MPEAETPAPMSQVEPCPYCGKPYPFPSWAHVCEPPEIEPDVEAALDEWERD